MRERCQRDGVSGAVVAFWASSRRSFKRVDRPVCVGVGASCRLLIEIEKPGRLLPSEVRRAFSVSLV